MNVKRQFKKDIAKIKTPVIENLSHVTSNNNVKHRIRVPFKLVTVMTVIILTSCLVIGVIAAGTVAFIKHINAPILSYCNVRLTEVPDGMTGIYTVSDLAQIRSDNSNKDVYGNYILMADINITEADYAEGGIFEGGWTPVGVLNFNGNGYVIRNLIINKMVTEENGYPPDLCGLFSSAHMVRNLGIEGCRINVTAQSKVFNIGGVSGYASMIYGCYATDVTINVRLDYTENPDSYRLCLNNYIGGICGGADYIDSCYTDAVITVDSNNNGGTDCYIGGISGCSFSAVTSYYNGSISGTSTAGIHTDNFVADAEGLPALMSETAFNSMIDTLRVRYPDKNPDSKTVFDKYSFGVLTVWKEYILLNPKEYFCEEERKQTEEILARTIGENSFVFDSPKDTAFYLNTSSYHPQHDKEVLSYIIEAYGSYNAFVESCSANNIKHGFEYCYTSGEKEFSGFDFNNIWKTNENGFPTLRIFG